MVSQSVGCVTVLAIWLAACANVCAADIQRSNDPLCAFKLDGVISPGDYDRLSGLLSKAKFDQYDERSSAICLRSRGGMYFEALKIAQLFYDRGVSTVIGPGAECFSACAVIFMAGVASDGGKALFPFRRLSAAGVLGFHAPFFDMPDGTYSKQQVEDIAQGMRMAISHLSKFSSKKTRASKALIKPSLLQMILEKGPDEVLFVKTIFDAARWNIEIYDADKYYGKASSVDKVVNSCMNFHYANMDEDIPADIHLVPKVEKFSSRYNVGDARILILDATTRDTVCELYPHVLPGSTEVSFLACSFDYWSSKSFGDCRQFKTSTLIGMAEPVPRFFGLSPKTTLVRLKN